MVAACLEPLALLLSDALGLQGGLVPLALHAFPLCPRVGGHLLGTFAVLSLLLRNLDFQLPTLFAGCHEFLSPQLVGRVIAV
jgi:hypothetical protein